MMPALASVLRAHKVGSRHSLDGSRVFATASGRSVSQRNATRSFEAAVERSKVQGVTFHALRHTFASILIGQGADPVFVADQLGHSKPSFTLNTYAHLFRAARHARQARKQLQADYGALRVRARVRATREISRLQPPPTTTPPSAVARIHAE